MITNKGEVKMRYTKKFEEDEDFADMCKPYVLLFVAYTSKEREINGNN